MKFKPLADRVLVKPIEESAVTASGIVLPDSLDKEPERGEVIAVGSGRFENGTLIPMSVSIGDKVVFGKYGPNKVKIDGEEYYFIEEKDILAVIS